MGLPGREAAGAKNQRWEEKLAKAEALPSRRDGRGGGGGEIWLGLLRVLAKESPLPWGNRELLQVF